MKRILVTGATGFIGKHCLPLLIKEGFEVHALTSKSGAAQRGEIHFHQVDLLQATISIKPLVDKIQPTHLLHLAWEVAPGKFWTAPSNLAWVQASLELVRAFAEAGGKHLVMAGTCAEYAWNTPYLSEDQTPYQPTTLYGAAKRGLYLMLEPFCKQQGIRLAWGHIFYLFGQGEYPQRFVPNIIQGLLQKRTIPCSHGLQVRDFLHVGDVAGAFVALVNAGASGCYNIGSGYGITLKEVALLLAQYIGSPELLAFGALSAPLSDPPELVANTQKIARETGWAPQKKLAEALQETIAWWQTHA